MLFNPFPIVRLDDPFLGSKCGLCGKPQSHWRLDIENSIDICGLCLLYRTTFGELVNVREVIRTLETEYKVPKIALDRDGKVADPVDASMIVSVALSEAIEGFVDWANDKYGEDPNLGSVAQ